MPRFYLGADIRFAALAFGYTSVFAGLFMRFVMNGHSDIGFLLPAVFALALTFLTLAVGALAAWAATGVSGSSKIFALRAVAVVLLLNVPVPHLTAAWASGGYAPGAITAVLVNLPVAIWVLWALRRPPQPE